MIIQSYLPYRDRFVDVFLDLFQRPVDFSIIHLRQLLRVQTKGAEDIEFNSYKVMTEARYNVGYLAWWCAVRTTFN